MKHVHLFVSCATLFFYAPLAPAQNLWSGNNRAVEILADSLQCPLARIAGVPMPCPNKSHGAPVFHMHIGKTGGRSVYTFAPALVGQSGCGWNQANLSWGRPEHFVRTVREHRAELEARPCFTTYEVGWRAVDEGFGPSVPPIVLTTLREPLSWVVSAIEHDKIEKRRNKGVDDVVQRGCLFDSSKGEIRPDGCFGYDYMNFVLSSFLTEKATGRFRDVLGHIGGTAGYHSAMDNAPNGPRRLQTAKVHLDASVFGLIEHFRATKCLWAFQFGHRISRERCDCRARQSRRRLFSDATLNNGRSDAVHVGARKMTRETIKLHSLEALRRVTESPFGALYAHALSLFLERAEIVEAATSIKLVCGFDR